MTHGKPVVRKRFRSGVPQDIYHQASIRDWHQNCSKNYTDRSMFPPLCIWGVSVLLVALFLFLLSSHQIFSSLAVSRCNESPPKAEGPLRGNKHCGHMQLQLMPPKFMPLPLHFFQVDQNLKLIMMDIVPMWMNFVPQGRSKFISHPFNMGLTSVDLITGRCDLTSLTWATNQSLSSTCSLLLQPPLALLFTF